MKGKREIGETEEDIVYRLALSALIIFEYARSSAEGTHIE